MLTKSIIIILVLLINDCLTIPPCSPKVSSSKNRAKCGSKITKKDCESIENRDKSPFCVWNDKCCRGESGDRTCSEFGHNPDECTKHYKSKTQCYWDCSGDLVNNLGSKKLYTSLTYIGRDKRFDVKAPRKKVEKDGKTKKKKIHYKYDNEEKHDKKKHRKKSDTLNDWEYVHHLYNEQTDEIGVTYKAKVNPSSYFSAQEINNKGYLSTPFAMPSKGYIKKSIGKIMDETRRKLMGYEDADWQTKTSTSYGVVVFSTYDISPAYSRGVGTLIWHSTDNNRHYDHILTAGHNCKWDGNNVIKMMASIGYNEDDYDDPFFENDDPFWNIRPAPNDITHGFVADNDDNNGNFFQKKIGVVNIAHRAISWDYCVVSFEVDQERYPRYLFQFDHRYKKDPPTDDINLRMLSYRVHDYADFNYQQCRSQGNKINYKLEAEHFCSVQPAYTEQGMSGSAMVLNDMETTIIGVHVGRDKLNGDGDNDPIRSCANRITRAKFVNIFRWIGEGDDADCIVSKNPDWGRSNCNFVATFCSDHDSDDDAEEVDYDDVYRENAMVYNNDIYANNDIYGNNAEIIASYLLIPLIFILCYVFYFIVGIGCGVMVGCLESNEKKQNLPRTEINVHK